MFNKSLKDLKNIDIRKLKKNKIPESQIIDYKEDIIEDTKLIKEICGFANAQGGYLIFGIRENEDEPPIPKSLPGISLKKFNMQRTEQVINTNIVPRLSLRISPPIYRSNRGKCFIIIRIPEGSDKPYMSNKTGRFYLRYNNETRDMTEPEISNMYRQRFSTPQLVADYLEKTVRYHKEIADFPHIPDKPIINGHNFVFPANIERRRIEHIDDKTLSRTQSNAPNFREGDTYLPMRRKYNQFGIEWDDKGYPPNHRLEVHRNGLIHNAKIYGKSPTNKIAIGTFKENTLLSLKFAHWVYSKIEYFGPVSVLMLIQNTKGTFIPGGEPDIQFVSSSDEIRVERESNSWQLLENHKEIVKSMLDELMNHFGYYDYSVVEEI